MAAHWIDRSARWVAGARPHQPKNEPPAPEATLTRATALKAAAAFSLAGLVPGLRPSVALGSDACQRSCDAMNSSSSRELMRVCLAFGASPIGGVPFPSIFVAKTSLCATGLALSTMIVAGLCGTETINTNADGTCAYGGDDPPPRPRTKNLLYPPKPLQQSQRKKAPPKKKPPTKRTRPKTFGKLDPSNCRGILPGQICCGSKSGPTICGELGCHRGGGCCFGSSCG